MISSQAKVNFFDSLLREISNDFSPEEVYEVDVLEDWARDNGFVKEGEKAE